MVQEIATALTGLAMTMVVVAWSRFYGTDRLQQVIPHPLSQQADSSPMLRTGEPCLPFRRECGGYPKMYRGTARRPFPTLECKKNPVSEETGDFPYKLFDPIRRAPERRGRRSLRSEFYTQSGDCQIRTMPDHTSSARLSTSKTSDSLAPGPARKKPPFPEKRGFSKQIVRPNTQSGN